MTQEQEQQWQDPWTDQNADPLGDLANLETIQAAQRLRAECRVKLLLLDSETFGLLASGKCRIAGLPDDVQWLEPHFDPAWRAWLVKLESVNHFPPTDPACMLQVMVPGDEFQIEPTDLLTCEYFDHANRRWHRKTTGFAGWEDITATVYPTMPVADLLNKPEGAKA